MGGEMDEQMGSWMCGQIRWQYWFVDEWMDVQMSRWFVRIDNRLLDRQMARHISWWVDEWKCVQMGEWKDDKEIAVHANCRIQAMDIVFGNKISEK